MNNIYKSSSYRNDINSKQVLILDIDDQYENDEKHILGSTNKFNIKLHEPIIIDQISELYLDNVITYNCNVTNDNDNCAFIVNIDQFNVKTNIASNSSYTVKNTGEQFSNGNNIISGNIVIPNENSDINNYFSSVIHKSKKLNYLADIPSGRFDHISGTITNLNGDPIFHGQHKSNNYTYMLENINWKWNGNNSNFSGSDAGTDFNGSYNGSITNLKRNAEFILSAGADTNTYTACVLLNDTIINSPQIFFSTSASHQTVLKNFSNCSNINMMFSSDEITDSNSAYGGTPHKSDSKGIILTGLETYKNINNMNLFITRLPDLNYPTDNAFGNPSLYYDTGRFLAEFTIVEKK